MQVGWVKTGDFRQISGYISKTVIAELLVHSRQTTEVTTLWHYTNAFIIISGIIIIIVYLLFTY